MLYRTWYSYHFTRVPRDSHRRYNKLKVPCGIREILLLLEVIHRHGQDPTMSAMHGQALHDQADPDGIGLFRELVSASEEVPPDRDGGRQQLFDARSLANNGSLPLAKYLSR
jgi:hypothetical protein